MPGMPQMSVAVVGAAFPNKRKKDPSRRFAIGLCLAGDPVELRPEPDNAKDERAIAVFNREGMMMGYVPAERAALFTTMLARGESMTAIFQQETQYGAVIRVAFGDDEPVLPPVREAEISDDDPDFYPDPIYPDD